MGMKIPTFNFKIHRHKVIAPLCILGIGYGKKTNQPTRKQLAYLIGAFYVHLVDGFARLNFI